MQVLGTLLFVTIMASIGFCAGYFVRASNEVKRLDPHEKRLAVHYLTLCAEDDRVKSDALKEAGFERPSVIDNASDLDALVKKINKL